MKCDKEALQQKECLEKEMKEMEITKNNAIQGWKLAQEYAVSMEELKNKALIQEEETVYLRNEAICERDIARDLASQAQHDHALAIVHQQRAEAERDEARKMKEKAQIEIETKIMEWSELVSIAEKERKNIHKEVKNQTVS